MEGEKTPAELAQQCDVHPDQITVWRGQLLEGAAAVFGSDSQNEPAEPAININYNMVKLESPLLRVG